MECKDCGGTMSRKTITYKGQPKQIFECNQDNGACLNDKGYPNSFWPKNGASRGGGYGASTRKATPPAANGNDNRSNRIERQHSQEMALRYIDIKQMSNIDTETVRKLTDWFQRDIGRAPAVQATEPVPQAHETVTDNPTDFVDEPPF